VPDLTTFAIAGDHTSEFTNGANFNVTGSIDNGQGQVIDLTYTVISSTFDSTNTLIVVDSISVNPDTLNVAPLLL